MEVIDIISALTVENVFLNFNSEEKREEADEARRLLIKREGDHLTLLAAVQSYAAEQTDRGEWAKRYSISHRAMRNIMDVRKQLRAQCSLQKLLPEDVDLGASSVYSSEKAAAVMKSFLRGFLGNVARLVDDGSYRTVVGNHKIAIHPSSVLLNKKAPLVMYDQLMLTKKCYARNVSVVEMEWYSDSLAASSTADKGT